MWTELVFKLNDKDIPHVIVASEGEFRTAARHDDRRAYTGLTLAEAYADGRFRLLLLDMAGEVQHRWTVPDSVYRQLMERDWSLDISDYEIFGSHLFENGDALINILYHGLAKIDRCSNLIWFLDRETHHDQDVADDGTIWVLSRNLVTEKNDARPHFVVPYYEDMMLRVSSNGEVIDEISIIDAIFAGRYEALVLAGSSDFAEATDRDPTHANDIEIVDEAFASRNAFARPGDFLISLRTVDTIVLIDRESRAVKWAFSGFFLRQHDPDLMPDGTISIFDNRTDRAQHNEVVHLTEPQQFGYSRILRFDPDSHEILWKYEGTVDNPFYTSIQGDHQVLPNGNVMIVESEAGRIFEVDPETNDVVWEWINHLEMDGKPNLLGRVTRATRYEQEYPDFAMQGCG